MKCDFGPDKHLNYDFDKAIAEIRDLYDESIDLDERKLRLAALKELNRLHRLYEKMTGSDAAAEVESESSDVLLEIRNHLEPLGLAPPGTPVGELARLAALAITQK